MLICFIYNFEIYWERPFLDGFIKLLYICFNSDHITATIKLLHIELKSSVLQNMTMPYFGASTGLCWYFGAFAVLRSCKSFLINPNIFTWYCQYRLEFPAFNKHRKWSTTAFFLQNTGKSLNIIPAVSNVN